MTPNDRLTQINQQLRRKRPAAKAPTFADSKTDVAALKQRTAQARQQVAAAMATAKKLNSHALIAQIRELSFMLAGLEADLASISGAERRLVRLINTI
jgi:hypothetical protein